MFDSARVCLNQSNHVLCKTQVASSTNLNQFLFKLPLVFIFSHQEPKCCKFKNRLLKTQRTCHRKCMLEVKLKKKEIQLEIVNRDYHKSMIFQYVLCTRDELVFFTHWTWIFKASLTKKALIGTYSCGHLCFFLLYTALILSLSIYLSLSFFIWSFYKVDFWSKDQSN